jgi:hypothetical protein
MFRFRITLAIAAAIGLWAYAGQQARADFDFTVSGSGTSATNVPIAASAEFSFVSATNTLTITLANTSGTKTTDPGSTLTGLYFNLSTTLTPVSAALRSGSFLVDGTSDKFGATQVGQGWAYGNSGVVPPSGNGLSPANTGIISTGYGSFPTGTGNFAANPVMLDGVAWGIIPSANGNTGLNGSKNGPVVNDAVVFTLTSPSSLSASDITGVEFAYGTGNGEGGITTGSATTQATTVTVPAPPSAFLLGFGGLSCLVYWCKRRRLPAAA